MPRRRSCRRRTCASTATCASRGLLAINGPVLDQPDESLRGLCLYRVPPAEAAALAAGDPLVQRGRLVVEAMTWMVPAGIMRV